MAGRGDCFLLPKPGRETEHLWLVITNPDPVTHDAIMVNVTTRRPHSDTTTILQVGDHPFVQKPSVIFYADARMVDTRLLDAAVQRGAYQPHVPFLTPVLRKIQQGLLSSGFTPKKIKTAYAAYVTAGLA
jgi:hypothetical protein